LDYTIHWPELRSVDFTAAAEDNFFLRAGDATAVSKQMSQVAAVAITGCTDRNQVCVIETALGV
jgi:hypothetical protein